MKISNQNSPTKNLPSVTSVSPWLIQILSIPIRSCDPVKNRDSVGQMTAKKNRSSCPLRQITGPADAPSRTPLSDCWCSRAYRFASSPGSYAPRVLARSECRHPDRADAWQSYAAEYAAKFADRAPFRGDISPASAPRFAWSAECQIDSQTPALLARSAPAAKVPAPPATPSGLARHANRSARSVPVFLCREFVRSPPQNPNRHPQCPTSSLTRSPAE